MDKCFESFLGGNFDKSCITLLMSKLVSFMIVGLSFTFKVPQIKNMLKLKTDKGLSYLSAYLEILICLFSSVYGFHKGNPFSAYGESVIILAQCLIIVMLCWKYTQKPEPLLLKLSYVVGFLTFTVLALLNLLPESWWFYIGSSSVPLMSLARMSQIWTSFRTKDTGTLSSFTFVLAVLGGLSRVFTNMTETKDMILTFSYLYGVLLNATVLVQVLVYGNKSEKSKVKSS